MRPWGPYRAGGHGSSRSMRRPGAASGGAERQLPGRARDRLRGGRGAREFPGLHPAGPGAQRSAGGGSGAARRAQPGPAQVRASQPGPLLRGPRRLPERTLRAGGSRTSRVGTYSSRSPARPAAASSKGGSSDSTFPAIGGRAGGRGVVHGAAGSGRPRARDPGVGARGGARTGTVRGWPRPLAGQDRPRLAARPPTARARRRR